MSHSSKLINDTALESDQQLYITCPKGLEGLLADELASLGAEQIQQSVAAVRLKANLLLSYRIMMWSRLANRVVRLLAEGEVESADDLYHLCYSAFPANLLSSHSTIAVDFNGSNKAIRHSQFGAQVAKDAFCDAIFAEQQQRFQVDIINANVRWYIRLYKKNCIVGLDLVGESLHKRGYRSDKGVAPLKENLAAALVQRSGWPDHMASESILLDPMCGSGTLVIEAAMLAMDIAPGLQRKQWSFHQLNDVDKSAWDSVVVNAEQRREKGLASNKVHFIASDIDKQTLRKARENVKGAGLSEHIELYVDDVEHAKCPWKTGASSDQGMLLCNPPYGERLGTQAELPRLYESLGKYMSSHCSDWKAAIFSADKELSKAIGLRREKSYRFYNGAIKCELSTFVLNDTNRFISLAEKAEHIYTEDTLPLGAEMVFNRIKKNRKRLKAFLMREDISVYRAYDADLPEYAAIIDCYQSEGEVYLHIQEYTASTKIDAVQAAKRFKAIVAAASCAYQCPVSRIVTKQRQRQRGDSQYDVQTDKTKRTSGAVVIHGQVVEEHGHRFLINLREYLDTGLFIDHRALRRRIQAELKGLSFLNLFCYTATFTVYAAKGGASRSTSVDMSNTYLTWAKRNFELNGIDTDQHTLLRADCLQWLQSTQEKYDVILLDPPSFSNSKKMERTLDIQRDHCELINLCMHRLSDTGSLYFSNNRRSFRLDSSLMDKYKVTDITASTLDPDVSERRLPHHCWQIRHSG